MSVVDLLHILIQDRQAVIDRRRVIRNLHESKRLASAYITILYSDPDHAREELSDNRRNEVHRVEQIVVSILASHITVRLNLTEGQ
jgi:hypothetical protein